MSYWHSIILKSKLQIAIISFMINFSLCFPNPCFPSQHPTQSITPTQPTPCSLPLEFQIMGCKFLTRVSIYNINVHCGGFPMNTANKRGIRGS